MPTSVNIVEPVDNTNGSIKVTNVASSCEYVVWNNATITERTPSMACRPNGSHLFIFGNTSAQTDIRLQVYGNSTWFNSQYNAIVCGDFGFAVNCSCSQVRLISSKCCVITAIICSKNN